MMWIIIALLIFLAVRNCVRLGWRNYTMRCLISLDEFINVCAFGGYPDETISSRCGRGCHRYWYWRWLAYILNKIDPNHVFDAIKTERTGSHLPPELR